MRYPIIPLAILALASSAFSQTAPAPAKLKITIAKDTTFLTDAPLRPDGTVDYLQALDNRLKEGVTLDNNAAIPLLKILGPRAVPAEIRQSTLDQLGLSHLLLEGDYFQTFYDYLDSLRIIGEASFKLNDELQAAIGHPWHAADHPQLAAFLAREDQHLDAISAATMRDCLYLPPNTTGGTVMAMLDPPSRPYGQVAADLALRASFRTGQGDVDGALKDSLAAHRLARLVPQGGTEIDSLTGWGMEIKAIRADGVIISSGKLTAAQANTFRARLQNLPPLASSIEAINIAQRITILDVVMNIARGNAKAFNFADGKFAPDLILAIAQSTTVDWDSVLRQVNAPFDTLIAAAKAPTYAMRSAAWEQFDRDVEQNKAAIFKLATTDPLEKRIAQLARALIYSNSARFNVLYERNAMLADLDQLAFALAAYRADKGAYPDTLAPLAPAYIPAIPQDRFIDKPLIYKTTPTGFLLYSVGDDLTDDGGREKRIPGSDHIDIVMRVGD